MEHLPLNVIPAKKVRVELNADEQMHSCALEPSLRCRVYCMVVNRSVHRAVDGFKYAES
ncbi:hypothetical protein ACVWY0_000896 [Arthrobacter sp. UYNi723]